MQNLWSTLDAMNFRKLEPFSGSPSILNYPLSKMENIFRVTRLQTWKLWKLGSLAWRFLVISRNMNVRRKIVSMVQCSFQIFDWNQSALLLSIPSCLLLHVNFFSYVYLVALCRIYFSDPWLNGRQTILHITWSSSLYKIFISFSSYLHKKEYTVVMACIIVKIVFLPIVVFLFYWILFYWMLLFQARVQFCGWNLNVVLLYVIQ